MIVVDLLSAVAAALPDPGRAFTPAAAGLFLRVAAIVEIAAPAIVPGVPFRARVAASALVALAGLPALLVSQPPSAAAAGWDAAATLLAGEAFVGAALGFVVATLASAVGWAGAVLGDAAGLSWPADDEVAEAGVAALARWFSLGVFVSAGGLAGAVLAVIDGIRVLPIGCLTAGTAPDTFVGLAVAACSSAIGLAVAVALPGLAAILAFQMVAAMVLRAGACAAGPGLVHAAGALVLLAALFHGVSGWSEAAGPRVGHAIDGLLAPAARGTARGGR